MEILHIEIIIINLELNHKIPIVFHNLKNHDSYIIMEKLGKFTLREMCPNTEQKKLCIWTLFTQC